MNKTCELDPLEGNIARTATVPRCRIVRYIMLWKSGIKLYVNGIYKFNLTYMKYLN